MATAEKEKKDRYLQPFMERRSTLTPMVYSVDVIPRTEAIVAHQRIASLLRNTLRLEYSEMCGFVRARMSLAIVRSNILLLQGVRDKETYIRQRSDL